jgi:hypothetical protein
VKHLTWIELDRRITANFQLRNAEHDAMIDPATCEPRISPLSEEWAERGARYDQLAAESDAMYAELNRRDSLGQVPHDCRTCGFTHPENDCPRWPANA